MSAPSIIEQAREYVASRGTTAQPRAFDLARALVELAEQQPAAQPEALCPECGEPRAVHIPEHWCTHWTLPDMVLVPRDHVQTARALMDEAATILCDLDHPAAEWRAPIVDELTGASLILAAAPQQPAAQPAEDHELSAALGWPGGISSPVLDRQELLRMVAALRQQPAAQPAAWQPIPPEAEAMALVVAHEGRIETLTRERDDARHECVALRATEDNLRALLLKHVLHKGTCSYFDDSKTCNCGTIDAALARAVGSSNA